MCEMRWQWKRLMTKTITHWRVQKKLHRYSRRMYINVNINSAFKVNSNNKSQKITSEYCMLNISPNYFRNCAQVINYKVFLKCKIKMHNYKLYFILHAPHTCKCTACSQCASHKTSHNNNNFQLPVKHADKTCLQQLESLVCVCFVR